MLNPYIINPTMGLSIGTCFGSVFGNFASVNALVWAAGASAFSVTGRGSNILTPQVSGVGEPTFTGTELLLPDYEDKYVPIVEGEAPWHGARRVENLAPFSDNLAKWTLTNTELIDKDTVLFTDIWGKISLAIPVLPEGTDGTWSVTLSGSGSLFVFVSDNNGSISSTTISLQEAPTRYLGTYTVGAGVTWTIFSVNRNGGTAESVTIQDLQIEDVTGQANQNPGEYVPNGTAKAGAPELVVNGSFTEWTDPEVPDGYNKGGTHNASNYVEQHAEGMRIVSDGTFVGILDSTVFTPGVEYFYSIEFGDFTVGGIKCILGDNTNVQGIANSTKTGTFVSGGSNKVEIDRTAGVTDAIIKSISVKEAVPGYAFFDSYNGNTVVDNTVIEAEGGLLPVLPSLYAAPAATNALTNSRDISTWFKSNATATFDQAGLDGKPNTAALVTDASGTVLGYVNPVSPVLIDAGPYGQITARVFVKKVISTGYSNFYLRLSDGPAPADDNSDITINPETGDWVGSAGVEVNDVGSFWELLLTTEQTNPRNIDVRVHPAWGSDGLADPSLTGTCVVGNVELHVGKTIAEVRGSSPIITAGATVTTPIVQIEYDIENHDDEQGAYYLEWTPSYASSDTPARQSLMAIAVTDANLVYNQTDAGVIGTYDNSLGQYADPAVWGAGDTVKIGLSYSAAESKGSFNIDGSVTADHAYDGAYSASGRFLVGNVITGVHLFRNIRRYNLPYEEAKAKIDELM